MLEWMAPGLGGWLQGATSMLLIYALVTILMPVLGDLGHIPTLTKKVLQQGIISGLRSDLLVAVIFSVGAGFVYGRTGGNGVLHGIEDGAFAGLIFGLQRGLVALLRYEEQASQQAHQPFPIPRRARFLNSVIFGCCAFVGFTGVYAWQAGGINQLILLYGMVIGCLFGIIYGVSYGTARLHDLDLTIEPAEVVAWSWLAIWNHLGEILKRGIVLGATILVVVVIAVTAMSSLSYGIDYGFKYGLIYGLIVGLIAGVAGIVVGLLVSGWSSSLMDDRQRLVKPNEGIHRSLRHAVFAACLFGPIGGIASGLVSSLAFWAGGIREWYVLGLGFAIVFTVTFALEFLTVYGGVAVVEHALLRWYLWRNHLIPWKYAAFLDDATRRIFLRKRGEGYLFIHRLVPAVAHFRGLLFAC